METRVLKVMPHEFEGTDKELIKGQYVYLLVSRGNGSEETRRVFVSDERLAQWAHQPKAGDIVHVFTKNGKAIDMLKLESKASRDGRSTGDNSVPF